MQLSASVNNILDDVVEAAVQLHWSPMRAQPCGSAGKTEWMGKLGSQAEPTCRQQRRTDVFPRACDGTRSKFAKSTKAHSGERRSMQAFSTKT
eukprot:1428223-Pleurochrysis_carterae.AAC.3